MYSLRAKNAFCVGGLKHMMQSVVGKILYNVLPILDV